LKKDWSDGGMGWRLDGENERLEPRKEKHETWGEQKLMNESREQD
jgi:hypothetical protein